MFLPPNSKFCASEDLIAFYICGEKQEVNENTSGNPMPDKGNNYYFSVFSLPGFLMEEVRKEPVLFRSAYRTLLAFSNS